MKTLEHIFTRYTAFLWALLKPLGAWGVLAIAALDGAFLGLPIDAVVAGYVYQGRARFFLYVLAASTGSVLGSLVIYVIGYKGGEELLRKRIPAHRFEKIHSAFDRHPFWSLMFPAMLPPPTPFKLFALAAAVSEMGFVRFVLAIFAGRMVRFLLLSLLTLKFGPDAVRIIAALFREHLYLVMLVVAAGMVAWLMRRKQARLRNNSTAKDAEESQNPQRIV
ncbi:MAG TPA: VTT domain-containing protein [Terriglobales bacterium]|nr:VTT domain-containing protein [Terriglobales bacterium]